MLKQRLIYLAVLLGALAFYAFYWDYIAAAALALAVVLPVLSWLLLLAAGARVQAALSASSDTAVKGRPATIRLTVENKGFLAVANVRAVVSMKNEFTGETAREHFLFPVGGKNVTALELDVLSDHCGVVGVTLEKLRLYDLFGIFRMERKSGVQKEIAVLPELLAVAGESGATPSDDGESRSYSARKRGDDHSQIFDVRPYQDGDRLRDIHWKLSARLDTLLVKEYSLPIVNSACILWEVFGAQTDLEQVDLAVGVCASLSEWFSRHGASHTVEWYSPKSGCAESQSVEGGEFQEDLLLRIFMAGRPEAPGMLKDMLSRQGSLPFSSLIYLTTKLTNETTQQLLLLGTQVPVHVIYAAPERAADPVFVQELLGMGEITVTVLRGDTAEEGLSHFSV